VNFLWVLLALSGIHHHLRSRSTWLKQGPFPPARLCCPCYLQYYEPLRLLTWLPPGFHFFSLYQRLRWLWSIDQMRPPLFRRLLCAMHCTASIPLPLRRRVLHGCTPGSSPLPWPSLSLISSAPSGSRCRANISALQDSLHVTGCCLALLPQEDTPLHHSRSPGSTGSLPRGLLAATTVGLSPTSRRQLIRARQRVLGRYFASYYLSEHQRYRLNRSIPKLCPKISSGMRGIPYYTTSRVASEI
jgi:hypothetical protein